MSHLTYSEQILNSLKKKSPKNKKQISWNYILSGAHHLERTSPILSLRDNLWPNWAIFRIVSRKCLSPLWSAYGQNQRGKGKNGWGKQTKCVGLHFGCHFFQLWVQSYMDHSGDRSSRETHLKIAQSGHRLDHRYSVDVRSGWWAPVHTKLSYLILVTVVRNQC